MDETQVDAIQKSTTDLQCDLHVRQRCERVPRGHNHFSWHLILVDATVVIIVLVVVACRHASVGLHGDTHSG